MFTTEDVVGLAVQIEKNGEERYCKALMKVADPALTALLRRFAEEEVKHMEWFSDLKGRIPSKAVEPNMVEMGRSILLGILGEQAFSLDEADFTKIEQVEALVNLAIEFERDTVIFYEMMRDFIDDDATLNVLDEIINEENRHIQIFSGYLKESEIS